MAEEAKPNIQFDVDPFADNGVTPDVTIEEPKEEVQPEVTEEVAEETPETNEVHESEGEPEEQSETEATEGAESPEPEEAQEPAISEVEEIVDVVTEEEVQEAAAEEPAAPVSNLPEGVDKLVKFMEETGGTLEDYITLNKDFSEMSEDALLMEYYQKAKPHWSKQDILDHIEDEFTIEDYEEGAELDREDRRKLRLRKEEINNAKQFLEGQKDKYYENLRFSSESSANQNAAQQKAQQEAQEQARKSFEQGTQKFFGEGFEGFVFDGGDKKFRIREKGDSVMSNQIDLNGVLGKYLDDSGNIADFAGYHKAIYAFQNADKIFSHAYQQGKADALKERAASTKNIDMKPQTAQTTSATKNKPSFSFDVTPPGWE